MQKRNLDDISKGFGLQLWPAHLKPKNDELLSSWIIRFSHSHGFKVQTMCGILFGTQFPIWNRDIDCHPPSSVTNILANATGASFEQIEITLIRKYESVLFEKLNLNGFNSFILTLGVYHRKRTKHSLMYCSECLREDEKPYFRKSWRLAFKTICTKHHVLLNDACPNCYVPIIPHRVDIKSNNVFNFQVKISNCWNCKKSLTDAAPIVVEDSVYIAFQTKLENMLLEGFVDWAENPSMYALMYFSGLRSLISGLTDRFSVARISKSEHISPSIKVLLSEWPKGGLENARVNERHQFFSWISEILTNVDTLSKFIKQHSLRYSDLKGYRERDVFWYESVIKASGGCGYERMSDEEADSIRFYSTKIQGYYSPQAAKQISGRDILIFKNQPTTKKIKNQFYLDIMTNIDFEIASTSDLKIRGNLIRDKIMFAVANQLKLTQSAVAGLRFEDIKMKSNVKAEFWRPASNKKQAYAWAIWYWEYSGKNLQASDSFIFTRTTNQKKLSANNISFRFQRALTAFHFPKPITTYAEWIS